MKANYKHILPIAALGLVMGSPCFAGGPGAGTMPVIREPQSEQPVMAAAPQAAVPDKYVWDGQQNVGFVNGKAYYLGPGNVWMPMSTDQQRHFDDWLRMNPDWQSHAVKNIKYDRIEYYPGQGQNMNRQDQYRNSPPARTDEASPTLDHNGPPQ